jgi:hypothetical protein
MQLFIVFLYSTIGAVFAAGIEQRPPGELTLTDAWDVGHMLIGAVFGAFAHAVAAGVVGARVTPEKRGWRITAGALAGILVVAGLRSQNPNTPLSMEVFVVGPIAWLGSQAIETLSDVLAALREAVSTWVKKLFG